MHRPARRPLPTLPALAATLALLAVPAAAGAQIAADPAPLSLAEAVRLAVANHWLVGAADARAEAATGNLDLARSRRLPRLSVDLGYTRSTNPVVVFGTLLRQEAFGPANFAVDSLNEPDPLSSWSATVQATQALWAGGRIRHAVDAARLTAEATAAAASRTRHEVARDAVRAWSDAVLARYQLRVAGEVLATARAHVELAADLHESGLALRADVLQARLRASEAEEVVVRAESAVEVSAAALNLALGRSIDTPIVLPDALPIPPPEPGRYGAAGAAAPDADALAQALASAGGARPDLESAALRLAAARAGVALAHSGRLPELGLAGSAEANDPDFFGFQGTNWTVAAVARWTIFDGAENRAREAAARAQAHEAESMHAMLGQTVKLQVRAAWSERRTARQRLEQALAAIAMATESLRTVEDRYREGMVTVVELLDAQTMLTRSRAREIAARRDLTVAQADLDLATGALQSTLPTIDGETR